MNTVTIPDFAKRIETLPPLPAIVPAILEATSSETASAEQVAEVLRRDPTVAAKVLRIANSPFYSQQRDVTDVTRAVIRLGVMAVRNLVIGLCAGSSLRAIGKARQGHALIWYHSMGVAAAAEIVAKEVGYHLPEEAFIAGLLHDFGQLAMLVTEPIGFEEVAQQTVEGDKKFLYREREAFGMDHTEAGAELMRHWCLPSRLIDVARHHHTCDADRLSSDQLLAIVTLADTLAQRMGMGLDFATGGSPRTDAALTALNLSKEDAFRIAQTLPSRIAEAQDMFNQTERIATWASDETGPVALWVSSEGQAPDDMTRLLLETRGYTVKPCLASDLDQNEFSALIIFANGAESCPHHPGIELVQGLRQRDESQDIDRCKIPRDFSAFDLAWAEERLS